MLNPIISIDTIEGPLFLSICFGGLVPGWNLVLVCWEHEKVGRRMDNHLVALWAHSLGAMVMASVAAASSASASAASAAAAPAAPAASTTVFFGHSH